MQGSLLWGLGFGLVCLVAHAALTLARKKVPALSNGLELLMAGCGLAGGLKILWLVFSGELSRFIEAKPLGTAPSLSSEDIIYFAVGGIALTWVSVATIIKGFSEFLPLTKP